MHFSFMLIVLLTALAVVIVTFCLWLSLRIFGLKPDKNNLMKIVGVEVVFGVITSLVSSATKGSDTA
jgi:hypothetical protein